jgi:sugar/nucleoside kinase (ribokinase family)
MLCAVGDLVEDVVVWLSAPPRVATDTPVRVFHRRGGSAANVATFAAGIEGMGARFIGRVGDDAAGDRLVNGLIAAGVDARVQRVGRTGTIVVLVDTAGERTMLTDRGSATGLAGIPEAWLDGASVLHLPAYSLTAEPIGSTCLTLATTARRRGIAVSVDASSIAVLEAFGPGRFLDVVAALEPAYFFATVAEAELLDLASERPAPVTVVKAGAEPVRILPAVEIDVPKVDGVTDTTGAGDAFAAGFLVASCRGATPDDAARAGIALAATVLNRPGAAA